MPYVANVPTVGQDLNQSRSIINNNFQALVSFGNGYANMPRQSVVPTVTGTDLSVYNFQSPTTSESTLYVKDSTSAGVPITMKDFTGEVGWCVLPCGLLVKWGWEYITADTDTTINPTVISGGPNFGAALTIQLTPGYEYQATDNTFICGVRAAGAGSTFVSATAGSFKVYAKNSSNTVNQKTYVYYVVIGTVPVAAI
jgi:hypothetical protein